MQQIQGASNPEAMLAQILQNNANTPMISSMLRNGQSLESIARSLAQAQNVDINEVIRKLQGGL